MKLLLEIAGVFAIECRDMRNHARLGEISMSEISVKAHAKINLSLDVTGKRPDGYHNVSMVMQMIDLHDTVTIIAEPAEPQETMIRLSSGRPDLPGDQGNIAFRAAELFAEATGKAIDVAIIIEKRIPVAAGLAGGSTDAAAVLLGLNILCDGGFSIPELMAMSVRLGADVPFCVMGNAAAGGLDPSKHARSCALAEGIGEKLTPVVGNHEEEILPLLQRIWILLSKPPIDVSTARVYGALDFASIGRRPDNSELIAGLLENDLEKVRKNMVNVLENVTLKEYAIVMYTKNNIVRTQPLAALMSGSGPTVFALFDEKKTAEDAFDKMLAINAETYLVRSI